MSVSINELLETFEVNAPLSGDALDSAGRELGFAFPLDYRTFLSERNGGEGFIGGHYLVLWCAEELVQFNTEYEVAKYASGFIMFATDGGGEGFAFDTRSQAPGVVQVPLIGMSMKDGKLVAQSFTHLLERMATTGDSLF